MKKKLQLRSMIIFSEVQDNDILRHFSNFSEEIINYHNYIDLFIAAPKRVIQGPFFKGFSIQTIPIPPKHFSFLTLFKLVNFCKQYQIQVIHSNDHLSGLYGRFMTLFGFKNIHTFYDMAPPKNFKKKIERSIDKFLKNFSAQSIFLTNYDKKNGIQQKIATQNSCIIPNGINIEKVENQYKEYSKEYSRKEYSLPLNQNIWGAIIQDDCLNSTESLFKKIDPNNLKFIFAFFTNRHTKTYLDFSIKKYQLQKHILILDKTSLDEMTFLRCLDGFFSLSPLKKFSSNILNATIFSLPYIIPQSPIANEFSNFTNIFSYPIKDMNHLIETINIINKRPHSYNLKPFIKSNFSYGTIINQTSYLYNHVL